MTDQKKKISFVVGTRPEVIKLAPVIVAARNVGLLETHVCSTAQHRELLDQALSVFGIVPDADLNLMQPRQSLSDLTARALSRMDEYLKKLRPDLVVVQGDTTTVFAAAVAAFYNRIPVAHVEAGLRTWKMYSPYPEEMNRVLTSRLTSLHFAPTQLSKRNLLNEGALSTIYVTGNPVVDALNMIGEKVESRVAANIPKNFGEENGRPFVLITGHRRESFGAGFESICRAISELARKFGDIEFVYPVHLNPNVREPVFALLKNLKNVALIEPLNYLDFVFLMKRCKFLLSDSGGVQEEAPSFRKPVLVMRESTERPEAVLAGTSRLVGTDKERIVSEASRLLQDRAHYERMSNGVNPFGDGKASDRIVQAIRCFLGVADQEPDEFVSPLDEQLMSFPAESIDLEERKSMVLPEVINNVPFDIL